TLAGGKERLRIEDVGDQFFGPPDAIGIFSHLGDEFLIEHVLEYSARMIHQHPKRDVPRVWQSRKPRLVSKPSLDLRVEIHLAFLDKPEHRGRHISLADAAGEHAIVGFERNLSFDIGRANGNRAGSAVGKNKTKSCSGKRR